MKQGPHKYTWLEVEHGELGIWVFVFFYLLLLRHAEINNEVYYKGHKLFAMGNEKVNCSLIGLGWSWKQV